MAVLRLALLQGLLALAHALTWVKAGTGQDAVCAGIEETCSSVESCTTVAFGACGGLSAPVAYVQQHIVGAALISGSDGAYLTDSNLIKEVKAAPTANNKYRKYEADMAAGNSTYAMMNSGAFYGSTPEDSGAYLGTASYLMQSGSFSANTMKVTVASTPGDTATKDVSVCIAKKVGEACGTNIAWEEGSYKFSLFGYTMGSSFAVPADAKWFGVRVDAALKNFGSQMELTLNGDSSKTLGTTDDVTKLMLKELTGDKRELTIDFPLNYNIGEVDSDYSIPGNSKNVKIKVSKNGDSGIFIDYLFDLDDFRVAKKYFVYDPTVTSQTASQTPSPTSVDRAFGGMLNVLVSLIALAAVVV